MGAYSSWGMLAFTHHCIVQYAYKLVYPKSKAIFKDYAILGDDVMIKNKLVANSYLKIMTDLGLEISSQKSIISDIFSEFAKKLKGYNGIDISPIGPKLILGSLRYEYQLINLFVELMQRGLVHMNTFFEVLCEYPRKLSGSARKSLLGFVTRSLILDPKKVGNSVYTPMQLFFEFDNQSLLLVFINNLFNDINKSLRITFRELLSLPTIYSQMLPKKDHADLSFLFLLSPSYYKQIYDIVKGKFTSLINIYQLMLEKYKLSKLFSKHPESKDNLFDIYHNIYNYPYSETTSSLTLPYDRLFEDAIPLDSLYSFYIYFSSKPISY